MFRNYFKVAFRKLWQQKAFSAINILGLAIGMTACFLIFLYVHFELSYDGFHQKKDRIYRVVTNLKTPSEVIPTSGPSWAVAPNAADEFPEIEAFVRISNNNTLIRRGDVKFQETETVLADSSFFKVFDFPLVKGDAKTALKEQFSVVLSQRSAKKYFGTEDPIGKTILVSGDALPATITGVMADIPDNSTIKAEVIISMTTVTQKLQPGLDTQWSNYGVDAYFLLKAGVNAKQLEARMPAFLERRNGTEMNKLQMFPTLILEPLSSVYLHSTHQGNSEGNINNVYIFSLIAVFILLIACINFVNLTTARAAERAKEVGIRKVAGAEKSQLIAQFMGESVLICLFAFLLTVFLIAIALPLFNNLAGKTISTGLFSNPQYVLWLFSASVGIGLLAGIYPALVLTSFKPITVLKGRFVGSHKGIILRKSLVVAQFTISIALIIATLVVYNQMKFMRSRDLGFAKNQVVVLDTQGDGGKTAFYQAVRSQRGVQSVVLSSSVPGGNNPGAYSEVENKKGEMQVANLDLYYVDFDFIKQYEIRMLAGRPFSKTFATDTTQAMVLNEAAIKTFGYSSPEQAIGKRFKQWGREGQIIGVMKDFHFRSLQEPIKPLSMRIEPTESNLVSIKVSAAGLPATLTAIEDQWKKLLPNRPFSYYFLDEFFDKQYRGEERFGKLFLNFALLAIIISCLGLLGLASYSTVQRTKEIGIRKVLGASVSGIVNLLSVDFLRLVLLAFGIAAPLAWYFMQKWLANFYYRTGISMWVFVAAGMLALLVALLTVSFQAVRAAIANPSKSLRTE